jgi:hypothetical protein
MGTTCPLNDLGLHFCQCKDEPVRSINSKEEFTRALTRLVLTLAAKLDLTPTDLYGVVVRLRDIDSEIVTKFTEAHAGQTFGTAVEAGQRSMEFRREYLTALLEKESR